MLSAPLIFISIASYRDPQLIPTIEDALAKATRPENLRFGICWQHGDDEAPLPFANDPRFRIIDVPWQDSRGCCWARAECQKVFADEDWYLQLDSHHRFAPNWDRTLIATAMRTGSDKPVLTGLTPGFTLETPDKPGTFVTEPQQTCWRQFSEWGQVGSFKQVPIAGWQGRRDPLRARFITAGFLFAPGSFVRDVPYDPQLYFWGEEITLTIRAFTFGYDLFTPTEIVLWHLYADRDDPAKKRAHLHDDEHPDWIALQRQGEDRVREFFRQPFGCGSVRSVSEYEAYAGVSFKDRCVSVYTLMHLEPPNPPMPDGHTSGRYDVEITFAKDKLPADYKCINVVFRDVNDHPVATYEIDPADPRICDPGTTVGRLFYHFTAERVPFSWQLSPLLKDGTWGRFFYGTFFSGARTVGIHQQQPAA